MKIPPPPSPTEIQDKPWKYKGYSAFSRFAGSDDDFLVLRRFDVSSTRVLLAMQDNIARLEESLADLDVQCCSTTDIDLDNGSFRRDRSVDRINVISKLKIALLEYSKPMGQPMLFLLLSVARAVSVGSLRAQNAATSPQAEQTERRNVALQPP